MTLFDLPAVHDAGAFVESIPDEAIEHGEVFTRGWIVDLILDLVGYDPSRDLATWTLVEPACGAGAFLGPVAERVSRSCRAHGRPIRDVAESVIAYDLLPHNVEASRARVTRILTEQGWTSEDAEAVACSWVRVGDYLLQPPEGAGADLIIGNPPYVRLEDVPERRLASYRARWSTMTGRADLYVGFYEASLSALRPGGVIGFICADRWMRNQYGRSLRQLVCEEFAVDAVITMHDVACFDERVSAYPAITVLRNGKQGNALVADASAEFGQAQAAELVEWSRNDDSSSSLCGDGFAAAWTAEWFDHGDSWPVGSPQRLAFIAEVERRLPPLQDETTGTRVGIGIATGADKVYLTRDPDLVEPDRLLPLAMVADIAEGTLTWTGTYLVNPWDRSGDLVDLADFPELAGHFEEHEHQLAGRHIARKQPDRWYKTIDKVDHSLVGQPKLLLPDMKNTMDPVLDEGGLYPHHNLYLVVSSGWDLRVLGGYLLSRVAQAFVEAYAVRMRGGTLRFQAQYLRKIRVPRLDCLADDDATAFANAFDRRDVDLATKTALKACGLEHLPSGHYRPRPSTRRPMVSMIPA